MYIYIHCKHWLLRGGLKIYIFFKPTCYDFGAPWIFPTLLCDWIYSSNDRSLSVLSFDINNVACMYRYSSYLQLVGCLYAVSVVRKMAAGHKQLLITQYPCAGVIKILSIWSECRVYVPSS